MSYVDAVMVRHSAVVLPAGIGEPTQYHCTVLFSHKKAFAQPRTCFS